MCKKVWFFASEITIKSYSLTYQFAKLFHCFKDITTDKSTDAYHFLILTTWLQEFVKK